MKREKLSGEIPEKGRKTAWSLYGLQTLYPTRFGRVVGRILDGRYLLVGSTAKKNQENSSAE